MCNQGFIIYGVVDALVFIEKKLFFRCTIIQLISYVNAEEALSAGPPVLHVRTTVRYYCTRAHKYKVKYDNMSYHA